MPTYEYRCPKGHEFELFQRMSDELRVACPECGKTAERLLSGGAGLIFKGEGFYITDYRSDEYKKAASSDKESASSGRKTSGADPGERSSDSTGSSDGGSSKSKGAPTVASGASDGSNSSDAGKSSRSEA